MLSLHLEVPQLFKILQMPSLRSHSNPHREQRRKQQRIPAPASETDTTLDTCRTKKKSSVKHKTSDITYKISYILYRNITKIKLNSSY